MERNSSPNNAVHMISIVCTGYGAELDF
jgi:hypothetical protein